jgi:hypothetical protein
MIAGKITQNISTTIPEHHADPLGDRLPMVAPRSRQKISRKIAPTIAHAAANPRARHSAKHHDEHLQEYFADPRAHRRRNIGRNISSIIPPTQRRTISGYRGTSRRSSHRRARREHLAGSRHSRLRRGLFAVKARGDQSRCLGCLYIDGLSSERPCRGIPEPRNGNQIKQRPDTARKQEHQRRDAN